MAALTPQIVHAQEHVDHRDAQFIQKAARGNLEEIQTAHIALQRAQDPQVRAFANTLIQDHMQANNQLQQIANAKGVEFPNSITTGEEHANQRLQNKSGADFDRAVVDHWVKDHKKDIKEYDSEAKHAKDPQLKQYAISTLPTLQDHLSRAQSLSSGTTIHEPAGSGVHHGDYVNP